jgi:hypothetical protein
LWEKVIPGMLQKFQGNGEKFKKAIEPAVGHVTIRLSVVGLP